MRCEPAGSVLDVATAAPGAVSLSRPARWRQPAVAVCRSSRVPATREASAPWTVRAGSEPAHSRWGRSVRPGRAYGPARDLAASFLLQWSSASACASHLSRRTRWDGDAETSWRACPGSAVRRLTGTRDPQKAKGTPLRESPFARSLSGVRMLHHHSSRRKARAVTALCRRPVDRGVPPSSKGTG